MSIIRHGEDSIVILAQTFLFFFFFLLVTVLRPKQTAQSLVQLQ